MKERLYERILLLDVAGTSTQPRRMPTMVYGIYNLVLQDMTAAASAMPEQPASAALRLAPTYCYAPCWTCDYVSQDMARQHLAHAYHCGASSCPVCQMYAVLATGSA
jgi:hypothetical protein